MGISPAGSGLDASVSRHGATPDWNGGFGQPQFSRRIRRTNPPGRVPGVADWKYRFGNIGAAVMASDEDVPPGRTDQDPLRSCEKCHAVMKQLGELPALSIHAAIKVFRCYACDHVVTERA
jgi:hypothetical protein